MIFEDYWFYQLELACITSAIEVGLFSYLDGKKLNIQDIAKGLQLHAHALEPLFLNLVPMGFLQKDGERFTCTDEGRTLLSTKSEFYRGDYFVDEDKLPIEERLIQFLRTGAAPLNEGGKTYSEMWEKGSIDQDTANGFTGNMHSLMKYTAFLNAKNEEFSKQKHIVDVGGGSGAWALALARQHPNLRVTIFDLPPVLEAAKRILVAEDPSVLDRIDFAPGNFFTDPLPKDADSFLLSNILHDWPVPQCRDLLARISGSLPQGGRLFINECILDPGKTSPRFSVLFHLLMVMNHGAQQFTKGELDDLLQLSGFDQPTQLSLNRYYSLLVSGRS